MAELMNKPKKLRKKKMHYRLASEIEEEQSRTLYIRLPKTIKNVDEINELFVGNFEVKLPRQSGRYCHVIFSDVNEKIKNSKAIKNKLINGKRIFCGPPRPIIIEEKKKKLQHKKIVMEEPNVGKYLFISNIAPGVKAAELKNAFPGAITLALLKMNKKNGTRTARLKMPLYQCLNIIKNKSEWPILRGSKVKVKFAKEKGPDEKKKNILNINKLASDNKKLSKGNKEAKKLSNKVEIDNELCDENINENDKDQSDSNDEYENDTEEEENSE